MNTVIRTLSYLQATIYLHIKEFSEQRSTQMAACIIDSLHTLKL